MTAPVPAGSACSTCAVGQRAERAARAADDEQRVHREHEAVGREREQRPGLAHAAQVHDREQQDAAERELDPVRVERRRRRGDRDDPRRDRDRDRQHVVREQRGPGDEARDRAEVLLRDDVRAAARLVGAHGLPVRERDDREQQRDRDRDRNDPVQRAERDADEDDHRRLGGVRDRRERVGCEDREREELREQRLVELVARHRAADDDPLHDRPSRAAGRARRRLLHLGHSGSKLAPARAPACAFGRDLEMSLSPVGPPRGPILGRERL